MRVSARGAVRFVLGFLCFLTIGGSLPARAATWYIRPDGGTRYSSQQKSGQCDGQTDAAYPGEGKNQHCAFNDFR